MVQFPLKILIVEILIELIARLHQVQHALLSAFRTQGLINLQRGRAHGPKCGKWVEREANTHLFELLDCVEGSQTKLSDVGEYRNLCSLCELLVHGEFGNRLGEYHV